MIQPNPNTYKLIDENPIPTPNLLLYPNLVQENINLILKEVPPNRLRPHVKTNKCKNLVQLLLDAGVHKFKCATLQEARMLAELGAADILIAFPIVGTQVSLFLDLRRDFPKSTITIIVDSIEGARQLEAACNVRGVHQDVYVDINLGMNRTGITLDKIDALVRQLALLAHIHLVGLHGYDGHIREEEYSKREELVKVQFELVLGKVEAIEKEYNLSLKLVFGGSNTFPIYRQYASVECSPGTFVLWDWGYHSTLPEQSFHIAAMLLCRVVSKPTSQTLCLDLGYKAIASENPLDKRLQFLDKEDWKVISQSEEHLVVEVPQGQWQQTPIGDFVYVIPYHICPTVAMYPAYQIVNNGQITSQWNILGRYG